ncbi:hypothetical protein MES5069_40041 [Mesorhizobium escarrei]|uniref:Uncharacterized protein n=1 Tax=Mesorhizobium escarrei TaxID=666018 RepID=A0ABM9E3P8_9HYPH|nr:hypothetical protein MES5069_40041 [Mesorhizobium escarrei]
MRALGLGGVWVGQGTSPGEGAGSLARIAARPADPMWVPEPTHVTAYSRVGFSLKANPNEGQGS